MTLKFNPYQTSKFVKKYWFYILAIPAIIYFVYGIFNRPVPTVLPKKPVNEIAVKYVEQSAAESEAKAKVHEQNRKQKTEAEKVHQERSKILKNQKDEAIQQLKPYGYDSIFNYVLWASKASNADIRRSAQHRKTTN